MKLVASQSVTAGVEMGSIPEALEGSPGFVSSRLFVGVDRFHNEANPRTLQESGALVRLEDAVFEGGCQYLNHCCFHVFRALCPTKAYPIEFKQALILSTTPFSFVWDGCRVDFRVTTARLSAVRSNPWSHENPCKKYSRRCARSGKPNSRPARHNCARCDDSGFYRLLSSS
jgi:hypothetical protein